ncbi:MAG: hypothetical protein COU69_00505 [Candidatus Pacebacteria bacterium CG10_big_fil_rev_8_21_14_0_10_56_10]|nr:MAG: hypothetical protein COU69_00505 [Candidatus Pacebacteria bacterium CG10_big_fil_rev_8_21_14_0_10_56_10]
MIDGLRRTTVRVGPVLIVIAASLWAFDGVIRRSLFALPPVIIVFYEHLIGTAILAPIVVPRLKRSLLTRRVVSLVITVSLLSGLLGTLAFTSALAQVNFIAFSVVLLLQKLQPLFAIASARVFLKEKIFPSYAGWAVLALGAAFLVTFPGGTINLDSGGGTAAAALLALGAAAVWGVSTSFSKMLLNEVTHTQATGLRFMTTTVMALAAVAVFGQTSQLAALELSQFARLGIIALSTGMVALWIYYRGLQQTRAQVSTILELTFPLLAVVIDATVFKVFLAPSQLLAAAALVFAMYQVARLNQVHNRGGG